MLSTPMHRFDGKGFSQLDASSPELSLDTVAPPVEDCTVEEPLLGGGMASSQGDLETSSTGGEGVAITD